MKKLLFALSLIGVTILISCKNDDPVANVTPTAGFTVSTTETPYGEAVIFTDISFDEDGSIASWAWDFGDGGVSTEQNPSYTYTTEGTYTVVLTVTDNKGATNKNDFSKDISVVEPSFATTEPTQSWVFNLPNKIEDSSPALADDGTIYIGCSAKSGVSNVWAIKNGAKVWEYETLDIVRSAPSIGSDGKIYVGSYDNFLYCFNTDGTVSWKADMLNNAKYCGPAIATDGTIYIGNQNDDLLAVNPDGSEKWRFVTGSDVNDTPVIGSDGTVFFASTDGWFYAVNPDGSQKWKFNFGSWSATSPAIGSDGTVYFAGEGNIYDPVTYGGILIAFNPLDGSEKWHVNLTSKINRGGPAVGPDGTVYAGGVDNAMVAYNPANGAVKWTYPTNGAIQSTPAIDNDGNIYFGDASGYFYVIAPDGTKKWKETQLGSFIWGSPTIGPDGTIYIGADQSDGTSKLYALKTQATGIASGVWPMRSKNSKHLGR